MKRWGFKGQPASHGVSLAHRSPGAIGGRQDPGKVWKGKKLPGCMGDERRTVHHCLVYKVRRWAWRPGLVGFLLALGAAVNWAWLDSKGLNVHFLPRLNLCCAAVQSSEVV